MGSMNVRIRFCASVRKFSLTDYATARMVHPMTRLERIALYIATFVALWLIGTVVAALGVP